MLVEAPRHAEILGSVKIFDVQKVLKLESGDFEAPLLRSISNEEIEEILEKMVIIIPVKNERINLLDGVLRAIPQKCLIIVVSNSSRVKRDIFKMEEDVVRRFYRLTKHPIMIVHQKDPGIALSYKKVGFDSIIDGDGLVRDGKAEGMITGLLIAKHLKKEFIGFVDADNYFPSAVNEYVRDYAAGFCMSKSPYSMVRLHWKHKPKIVKRKLYFKKWGRVSEITNRYLNLLLANQTGFETDIIKTGNAGEHAITMELANIMEFSTGYSIEPYQLIYLFEEFGRGETEHVDAANSGIEVFQIETLNPHLHEEKGEKHIKGMMMDSLSTIFHSRLANKYLKSRIIEELKANNVIETEKDIKKNHIIPSIKDVDSNKFIKLLEQNSETIVNYIWDGNQN